MKETERSESRWRGLISAQWGSWVGLFLRSWLLAGPLSRNFQTKKMEEEQAWKLNFIVTMDSVFGYSQPFLCILGSLGADTRKTGPRGQRTSTVDPDRSCSWPWCSLS